MRKEPNVFILDSLKLNCTIRFGNYMVGEVLMKNRTSVWRNVL